MHSRVVDLITFAEQERARDYRHAFRLWMRVGSNPVAVRHSEAQVEEAGLRGIALDHRRLGTRLHRGRTGLRSEEHTSELQSRGHLVCRLLLEKNKWRAG